MRKVVLIICLTMIATCSLGGRAWAQVGPWQIAQQAALLYSGGPAVAGFLKKSNARGVNPVFVSQVLQNARGLQDRGFPPAPYLLKANEGLAKGIPPIRMKSGLRKTKQETEAAGRLTDYAIAQGVQVDSPGQRRKLTQQYQWALLNQVSPGQLKAATDQFAKQGGKKKDLFQLREEVRDWTQARRQGKWPDKKAVEDKKYKNDKKQKEHKEDKKHKKEKGPATKAPNGKKKDRDHGKPGKFGGKQSDKGKVKQGKNHFQGAKGKNGNKNHETYRHGPKKGGGNGAKGGHGRGK